MLTIRVLSADNSFCTSSWAFLTCCSKSFLYRYDLQKLCIWLIAVWPEADVPSLLISDSSFVIFSKALSVLLIEVSICPLSFSPCSPSTRSGRALSVS